MQSSRQRVFRRNLPAYLMHFSKINQNICQEVQSWIYKALSTFEGNGELLPLTACSEESNTHRISRFSETGSCFSSRFLLVISGCGFLLSCFSERHAAGKESVCLQWGSLDLFTWLRTWHECTVTVGVCLYLQNFILVLVLYLPVSSNAHWVQGDDIAITIDMAGRDGVTTSKVAMTKR